MGPAPSFLSIRKFTRINLHSLGSEGTVFIAAIIAEEIAPIQTIFILQLVLSNNIHLEIS